MDIGNNGPVGQPASGTCTGETAKTTTPTIDHTDAPLVALEQEHDQLEASIKGLSEEETDKRASRAIEMARDLWERPASTLHGAAAKLRVLRYHAGQMKRADDVLCLDTCLDALDRVGDVNLILMEQEHNWRYFETKFSEDSKEADENTDKIAALAREIATRPAHTAIGAMVKLRVMREYQRHSIADWYGASWDTALDALMGSVHVAPVAACNKSASLNPELLEATDLLRRIKELDIDKDEERVTALIAEMYVLAPTAVAKPAQNFAEVLTKMRLALWHEGDREEYAYDLAYLKSAISDMERFGGFGIGTTVPVDSDAALQDLWREYQQCLKDWGPDETPEDEKARDRSFELERQIVETPAQSIFGVAVKLWIATHDNLPHKEPEYTDEKALVGACDDAVRLAGIGGAA